MRQANEDPRVARSRAKVLATARDLLQEGGIAAVTIDTVAADSGVAKTTIYRHWPSRGDLVVELFASLAPVLPPPETSAPLRAQLVALLTAHARQLEDQTWAAALPALIAAADRDAELDGVRRRMVHGAQSTFVTVLDAHTDQLGAVDPRSAAAQLFGPLLHRRLIDTGPIDTALIEWVVDCFLTCHQPAAGGPANHSA